jgi:hypothetical protein
MLILFYGYPAKSVRTATKFRHRQTSNILRAIAVVAAAVWNLVTLEDGAINLPEDRAHSRGGRNWTAIGMKRHRQSQPHVQKPLGSVEIVPCKKQHTTEDRK